MFNEHKDAALRTVKRSFVPVDPKEKEQKHTISSPIIDGKRFIGSGEDAHVYSGSSDEASIHG